MENSENKKKRRVEKPPLSVTGRLAMPKEILPFERDLLAALLDAVDGAAYREEKADPEVAS